MNRIPTVAVKGKKGSAANRREYRHKAPTLPPPIFWSTVTHPSMFDKYIQAEHLGPEVRARSTILMQANTEGLGQIHNPVDVQATSTGAGLPSSSIQCAAPAKTVAQSFSNVETIESMNKSHSFVTKHTTQMWIEHLLRDSNLPKPYDIDTIVRDPAIWHQKDPGSRGADTFRTIPTLSEEDTMTWLNDTSVAIGLAHGILQPNPATSPDDENFGWHPSSKTCFRVFNHAGRNKPLSGGFNLRKPDMVLLNRDHPYRLASSTDRLDWGPVHALVEVSVQDSHYQEMMTTLQDKAANIFHSQLHRNYVLALALFGKGENARYFFALIDRGGVLSTRPAPINGFDALLLGRIIYALVFGDERLLGLDPKVIVARDTGLPLGVHVDGQYFTIVKAIHISPILCGRGTRVYIVKDKYERFHILKDSWVLMTHAHQNSEIQHLKHISAKAKEKRASNSGTSFRSYLLQPRFVAGEEEVANTNTPRGYAWVNAYPRIRRRMVNGPIGDPITSYRSRAECLQALIDIADGK